MSLLGLLGVLLFDLASALAALSSESAEERRLGERWLEVHLEAAHLPDLAAYWPRAHLEARTRLMSALASDERHFELALHFALDRDPALAQVGRAALQAMVDRRQGTEELRHVQMIEPLRARVPDDAVELSMDTLGGTLGERFDRLLRFSGPGLPRGTTGEALAIVLDVDVDASLVSRSAVRPGAWSTSFDQLFHSIARDADLRYELYAVNGAHPWLRVMASSGADEAGQVQHLVRWCGLLLNRRDPIQARRAARALGALGWSGVLEWLARRWRAHDDPAALAGLAFAASRERVAPSLARREGVQAILELAESTTSELERRELIAALDALGPWCLDGTEVAPLLVSGFEAASESARLVRLAVVARRGGWRGPLPAKLRDLLAAKQLDPSQSTLALTALAALGRADVRAQFSLGAPALLLAAASRRGLGVEFGATLGALGVASLVDESSLAGLDREAHFDARLGLLEAALVPGQDATLAARRWSALVLGASLDEHERIVALLRTHLSRGEGRVLQAVLETALSRAKNEDEVDALEVSAAIANLLPADRQRALFDRASQRKQAGLTDWVALGALAGGPLSAEVRRWFEAGLARPPVADPSDATLDHPWCRGLERALLELRATHATAAAGFLARIERSADEHGFAALEQALGHGRWPVPASLRPRDLDREARGLLWP